MTLFFFTPGFAEEAEKKSSGEKEEVKTIRTTTLLHANPAAGQSPAAQEKEVSLTAGWEGGHPTIRSTDGNFLMRFGGRMQLDYRGYTGADAPTSTFLIRRARLEVDGNLYNNFEYKIQAEFADTGSQLLRDAFLNVNYTEKFQVMAGHFEPPFSQEELQTSKYIDFVELSSVGNLVPERSPGVMAHGALRDGLIGYEVGAFNGQGILGNATDGRPEVFGRLRVTPWKTDAWQFSFGGAVSNGKNGEGESFRGRAASQSFTFFDHVPVLGEVQRYNAEFWWTYQSFSLRGEYDQSNQFREGLGGGGGNLPGVIGKGFVFQATYLLTGEKKGLQGIKPLRNFRDGGGLGAWEVAGRFERLQLDDDVNSNHATAWTLGVNWWLNKFVRYQANVAFERFHDPLRAPEPGNPDHMGFLSRIQVIF